VASAGAAPAGTERAALIGVTGALGALLLAAPRPDTALADLRAVGAAADATAPVVALLALCAWLLAGWLALTLLLALLTRAPGTAGRLGRAAARRVAPAAVRRAVEVALGLGVTVGAFGAAGPAVAAPEAHPPAVSQDAHRSLDRGGSSAVPDLDWPAPAEPAGPEPGASGRSAAEVRGAPAPVPATAVGPEPVVVRPGDSLWRLAERDLTRRAGAPPSTAQTAAAWPAWWAANREAVGDDPDLLRPGTVLRPPTDTGPRPGH
jgi:hypothetical protein